MNSNYIKEASKIVSMIIQDIMHLVDIPNDDFLINMGNYISFDLNDKDGDYLEGIKTAIKRGLSPKYFEQVEYALFKILNERDVSDGIKENSEKEIMMQLMISALHIFLKNYNILNRSIQIADNFFWPEEFNSPNAMKHLSPAFTYRLNQCFHAISELNTQDIYFLIMYHLYHQEDKIDRILPDYYDVSYNQIFKKIISPNFMYFRKLQSYFCDRSKGCNSDAIKNWTTFISHYKRERTYKLSITKEACYTKMNIFFFIGIIYPKGDALDTDFTERDIDALIKFRLFLSTNAQKQFLNDIKEGHPRPS